MNDEKCAQLGTIPHGTIIAGKPYPVTVTIEQVENGFIVRVGCKTFIGGDWGYVANGLGLYFIDPEKARKQYCK